MSNVAKFHFVGFADSEYLLDSGVMLYKKEFGIRRIIDSLAEVVRNVNHTFLAAFACYERRTSNPPSSNA